MSLSFAGTVDLGRFVLDAQVEAKAGESVALIGPNGSGKTTLLSAVAGLKRLSSGRLVLDDQTVDQPGLGLFTPSERRKAGVVFQDLLLFPHLSVIDNVAYGIRRRGVPAAPARERAREWLARFALERLGDAPPRSLSGGQAQLVALARALATEPRLLLLDEPLSALDAGARLEVRRYLKTELARFKGVSLLVTHDLLDVLVLADRVVELQDGKVAVITTPDSFYRRPRTAFGAALVGTNLLRCTLRGRAIELGPGAVIHDAHDGLSGGPVDVVVPPAAVQIERADGAPGPGSWHAPIVSIEATGDRISARIGGPAPLTAYLGLDGLHELDVAPGTLVCVTIDPAAVHIHTNDA